jgi:hypothetical protein
MREALARRGVDGRIAPRGDMMPKTFEEQPKPHFSIGIAPLGICHAHDTPFMMTEGA